MWAEIIKLSRTSGGWSLLWFPDWVELIYYLLSVWTIPPTHYWDEATVWVRLSVEETKFPSGALFQNLIFFKWGRACYQVNLEACCRHRLQPKSNNTLFHNYYFTYLIPVSMSKLICVCVGSILQIDTISPEYALATNFSVPCPDIWKRLPTCATSTFSLL